MSLLVTKCLMLMNLFLNFTGGKFLEGQTITLEDGSTAVVQGITQGMVM